MLEGALYVVSSFWLGAVHAATPGHGKTVSAAYLVGTRGRPSDALALGIVVTLSHTSGIIVFAALAALGSTVLSQRSEIYLSFATAVLMAGVGVWMLMGAVHRTDHDHTHPGHHHEAHRSSGALAQRPSWRLLFTLGIAGGLLPDPAALAVLLAALAGGKLVLGLLTVLVFSLGFASVLVLVGTVVGRAGSAVLSRVTPRAVNWLTAGTSIVIIVVGSVMAAGAWSQISALQ